MKPEKDDQYSCPRCDGPIPEQFYCLHCGYVPDWRRIAMCEASKKAA